MQLLFAQLSEARHNFFWAPVLPPPYSPTSSFHKSISTCPTAQNSTHYTKPSSRLLHLYFHSKMKELNSIHTHAKKNKEITTPNQPKPKPNHTPTVKTSNLKTGKPSAQLKMTAIITSCSEMEMFYFTSQLFITISLS